MSAYSFSEKHRAYMKNAYLSTVNVAEGAVRAGKTIDNVFVFASLLEYSPDKFHLASGSTLGNAKLNIGDCNGLGLEHIFGKRCRNIKYKGNEAMRIETASGEKIVIFAGGKNSDSYKRIRGNSYGMWIATEINLHSQAFIEEAMNRLLAARDRRVFWDLNPTTPKAYIYTEHLDRYAEKTKNGELGEHFYNYAHFTIFDNPTIPENKLTEIVAQYDKNSVWFRRDILGERCAAEGLVYRAFADSPDKFMCEPPPPSSVDFINIGVDFGGNRSKTTFVAVGFSKKDSTLSLTVLDELAIDGGKGDIDPQKIDKSMELFLTSLHTAYPSVPVRYIFADSEAQYLINGMRRHLRRIGESVTVSDCAKKPILDRIAFTNRLLTAERLRLTVKCTHLRDGLCGAVWDENDKRLDNFTSDIDILDAFEYAIERYM